MGSEKRGEFRLFLADESAVGVIELVLILVVLIALVLIFKSQITNLLNNIFGQINSSSAEVWGGDIGETK